MTRRATIASLALALLLGCEEDASPPAQQRLSLEELKDPETCKSCHPTHYREWKASMHAYATEDPIFVAMNKLGHEETGGELGTFCVNCHAPMAVQEGITDGSPESIEAIPEHLEGVTCYFCHNVTDVEGENNAKVTLANDDVMRGGIVGAIEPKAHGVAYSRFMNAFGRDSSRFCGGCHDIVNDTGVHLERTYAEYQQTIFSDPEVDGFLSCSGCHMPNREGLAAISTGRDGEQLATRQVHSHLWPGVDVAVTPWADRDAYQAAVECVLDTSIRVVEPGLSADPLEGLTYFIETQAGHQMPSGASQDRRLWVEVKMFESLDDDAEPFCTLGAVPDGEAVADFVDPGISCPSSTNGIPLFRDRLFDENGEETHMFWRAAPSAEHDSGVSGLALPGATTRNPDGTPALHTVQLSFLPPANVVRVALRVRMRPMDHDVLEELIDEGVLDASARDEIRTFTIADTAGEYRFEGGTWTWHPDAGNTKDCYQTTFCAFDEDAPGCD